MSEIFNVNSSICNYTVEIEKGRMVKFMDGQSSNVIVDQNVYKLWPQLNLQNPIVVEAIESNKTLQTVAILIEGLRELEANRKSQLVSIGGGIIQDVSTFTASSYMRGITWYYAPTTLLGMVDSCIGGKSSINVGQYKNIAGNFYPPTKIIVDVDFCKTLSEQQLIEGLCEAVKICYAHSASRFDEYLQAVDLNTSLHEVDFQKVVALSLKTKKQFIEEDEFDNGIRLLLNFGHTFGHALEGASNFKISHGVAVGLGMFSAYKLSIDLGLVKAGNSRIDKLLTHVSELLKRATGLEDILTGVDMESAVQKFMSDKKHDKESFVAILYDENGELIRKAFVKSDVNTRLILESFEFLREFRNEI